MRKLEEFSRRLEVKSQQKYRPDTNAHLGIDAINILIDTPSPVRPCASQSEHAFQCAPETDATGAKNGGEKHAGNTPRGEEEGRKRGGRGEKEEGRRQKTEAD